MWRVSQPPGNALLCDRALETSSISTWLSFSLHRSNIDSLCFDKHRITFNQRKNELKIFQGFHRKALSYLSVLFIEPGRSSRPRGQRKGNPLQTSDANLPNVSFDPTLCSTPRSSQSSGFASMLSLQRKIAERKAEDLISGSLFEAHQTRSSWSSGSLRRQQGLSMASDTTLSTENSLSPHGSAIEWEPAFSTIVEGIVS
jgi:hypothetical protein